jgi:hypothetical protein
MPSHRCSSSLIVTPQYKAIEVAMKDQANATFTGTYRGTSGLNSSVTLGVDEGPGVRVTSWISNGTDMINNVFWAANIKEYRLFPTDLSYEENGVRYHKYVLEFLFNEYGEEFRDTDFWSVCKYLSHTIGRERCRLRAARLGYSIAWARRYDMLGQTLTKLSR